MVTCISRKTREELYSRIFLHGIKNGFHILVIVPDMYEAYRMARYMRSRTDSIEVNPRKTSNIGFQVVPKTEAVSADGFSSAAILSYGDSEDIETAKEAAAYGIPVLVASVDPQGKEYEDYWDTIQQDKICLEYCKESRMLENREIRDQFVATFSIAEKEIDIICPWINSSVVNADLVRLMDETMHRGVRIKIGYGIGDGSDKRSSTSESTVAKLKKRFEYYGDRLQFLKMNTHVKLLICDQKYMMSGSYNFLSFTGEYQSDDERNEAVEYIVDQKIIEQRRQHFFNR